MSEKLKNGINILATPSSSWVIKQNTTLHVLINSSKPTWPTDILMPFFKEISENLLQDKKRNHIILQKSVILFRDRAQNMFKFGFRCSSNLIECKFWQCKTFMLHKSVFLNIPEYDI